MSMPSEKSLESILKEFDTVEAYLKGVHEILKEGHMPTIADLDDKIAHLCTNIEEAEPDVQEQCMPRLDKLLDKLNNCEDEMNAFQKVLGDKAQE